MMKLLNECKGSISIFLLLVMVPMYTCAYLAVEAAVYADAKEKATGAVNLAGNTVLSGYDRTLKELYGILAFSETEVVLEGHLLPDLLEMTHADGELSVDFLAQSALINPQTMEKQIKNSMKYEAPYNWSKLISNKLSIFTEAANLKKIFEVNKKYYKALSQAQTVLESLYNEITEVNLSDGKEEVYKSLENVLSLLPKLKESMKGAETQARAYEDTIKALENKEMRNLLESELSQAGAPSEADIEAFQKDLEQDIESIKELESGELTSESLSFIGNPTYEYLTKVFGQRVGGAESEKTKEDLDKIASLDIDELLSSIEGVDVSEAISKSVYKAIGIEEEAISEETSIASKFKSTVESSYVIEFLSGKFNCLTYPIETATIPGEQEYIVFGANNTSANFTACINSILALRILFNSVYVFTNAQMRQSALAAATAVAGWTGIGIPVAQNLLMLSWAAAESVVDIVSLTKGQTVPIYKTAATWSLGLGSVSDVLETGVKNYAGRCIDDLFSEIEDFSEEKIDSLKSATLEYADQTARSATEAALSKIMVPVESKITSVVSGVRVDYTQEELEKELCVIVDSVKSESAGVNLAKEVFKDYCVTPLAKAVSENLQDSFSGDSTLAQAAVSKINESVENAYTKVFGKLSAVLDEYEANLNEQVNKALDSVKDDAKAAVRKSVESYTSRLRDFVGSESEGKKASGSLVVSSGIGMSYQDYLRLFMLIGLSGQKSQSKMLKRCAVIMQINASKKDEDFDISKCYTSLSIKTKTNIGIFTVPREGVFAY